jgi:myo-inositol-1(or 4)-monophosphatase
MQIDSIENLLPRVKTAGETALEAQPKRAFKSDGSIVTKTDREIDEYLFGQAVELYPDANILTEETARPFDPEKPYTFAIDPIDGSDVFSQGMTGWCISIGLLDQVLRPAAGIVYAPRLGLLFFADVGKRASLNGEEIALPDLTEPLSPASNVMTTSRLHHEIDLRRYPGKIRSIGSAALHLCFPLIYPTVFAAIEGSRGRIWDIAGAHAINLSVGFDLEYLGGGHVNYATMTGGDYTDDIIIAGAKHRVDDLRQVLRESRTNRKENDDELG